MRGGMCYEHSCIEYSITTKLLQWNLYIVVTVLVGHLSHDDLVEPVVKVTVLVGYLSITSQLQNSNYCVL